MYGEKGVEKDRRKRGALRNSGCDRSKPGEFLTNSDLNERSEGNDWVTLMRQSRKRSRIIFQVLTLCPRKKQSCATFDSYYWRYSQEHDDRNRSFIGSCFEKTPPVS